jgi:hypothetical protein
VEKAGNRAVPQDIASLAGVDISKARTGLQNLASLTGGDLEVSDNGDIVYNFPNNFRSVLRSKSSAVAARETFEKVRMQFPYLAYYCSVIASNAAVLMFVCSTLRKYSFVQRSDHVLVALCCKNMTGIAHFILQLRSVTVREVRNSERCNLSSSACTHLDTVQVWPYVFYGVRVGFGVFLIASIVIVFTAIVALQSAGSRYALQMC